MPVEFERVKPGIYHTRWIGNITIKDLLDGNKLLAEKADEDDVDVYIPILDLQEMAQIPFDFSNLRRLAVNDPRCKAYVVINASYAIQLINKILLRFVNYDVNYVDGLDEAKELADELMDKYSNS